MMSFQRISRSFNDSSIANSLLALPDISEIKSDCFKKPSLTTKSNVNSDDAGSNSCPTRSFNEDQ